MVNAVCDSCNTVIPAEAGLKERLETALSETKLQEYKVTEEKGTLNIYAKGVPAHASTPTLGVNAAGVTFECLEKQDLKMILLPSIIPIWELPAMVQESD